MKSVLSSTALVLALSSPAFAEQHGGMFVIAPEENVLRASELVGARLYTSENDIAEDQMGLSDEWDDVGEISEIVMGQDGQVDFIVADIGGFLGLGEKPIAVSLDQLQFISDGEGADDWFVVLRAAQADLENAPDFEGWNAEQAAGNAGQKTEQMAGNTDSAAGATLVPQNDAERADQNADTEQMTAENQRIGEDPSDDGYMTVDSGELTADDLTGVHVFDNTGERIGEIGELVLTADGKGIEEAIIDVGGFLGMGEKPVAVAIGEMQLQREGEGGELRVTMPMSKEELEGLPRHEG